MNLILYLARLQLSKNNQAKKVVVTGSYGKSSTCHTLKACLPKSNLYSMNGCHSLPLSILGVTKNHLQPKKKHLQCFLTICKTLLFNWQKYDFLIAECGISAPNEMSSHKKVFHNADIVIFTAISNAHSANFRNQQHIFDEKSKIIGPDSLVLTNIDKNKFNHQKIMNFQDFNLKLEHSNNNDNQSEFIYQLRNQVIKINLAFYLPLYYSQVLAYALCLSSLYNIKIKTKIDNSVLPNGRCNLKNLGQNRYLLDSSYNAPINSYYMVLKEANQLAVSKKLNLMVILGSPQEVSNVDLDQFINEITKLLEKIRPTQLFYFGEKPLSLSFSYQYHSKLGYQYSIAKNTLCVIKGAHSWRLKDVVKN